MTRSELITRLSSRFQQLAIQDVSISVALILNSIGDHLAKGDRVEIRGFGSFKVNTRPPRTGRNPKTGEKVTVPAKPAPRFRPGLEMRECVESGSSQKP